MKLSIALTLIIIVTVFSFVSGYSIGSHNKTDSNYSIINNANAGSINTDTAAENVSPPSGGYGTPSSEKEAGNNGPSPGYGAPSPGYGQ